MIQIAAVPTRFSPLADFTDAFYTVSDSVGTYVFAEMTAPPDKLYDVERSDVLREFMRTNKGANFLRALRKQMRLGKHEIYLWLIFFYKRTDLLNPICLSHISKISKALAKVYFESVVFKDIIQQKSNPGSHVVKSAGDVAGVQVSFTPPDDFWPMSSISIAKTTFNREPCGGHIADVHASLCHVQPKAAATIKAFSERQSLPAILALGLRSAKAVPNVDYPMTIPTVPEVLAFLSEASLRKILPLYPRNWSVRSWRQRVLRELCEGSLPRFARELSRDVSQKVSWAMSAGVGRRITKKTRTAKPRQSDESQIMENSFGHEDAVEPKNAKSVCVIIAAYNAEESIARAVTSALNQAEVSEVIVVDDSSTDTTVVSAQLADDGTRRLKLIELSQNVGPAEARNIAIDSSNAPLIAVLDADDFFLRDRFKPLIENDDWDFIGDNIVFLNDETIGTFETTELLGNSPMRTTLSFDDFIAGNISKRGLMRGELGFLKPVMKREFLQTHGIRYQRNLRLGEDYELYARALLKQARFKISPSLGYGAIIRSNSLSAKHQTSDLGALVNADSSMLENLDLCAESRSILMRHKRHIHSKFALREFLDLKNDKTAWQALKFACSNPSTFLAVFSGIAVDKLGKTGLTTPRKSPANVYRDQQVLFPINRIGANQ